MGTIISGTKLFKQSWICQRILNNLPISENARRLPFSLMHQMINPIAIKIQDTYQELNKAKANVYPSSFNMALPSDTWYLDIDKSFEFGIAESNNDEISYTVPDVYGTIGGSTITLDIAPNNDLETFIGNNIPTRIEYANDSVYYLEVLPETLVSDMSSVTLNEIEIPGHLYITVKDNTIWRHESNDVVYFPKVRISGKTRRRTDVIEEVPILSNGTFKTVNQWIFVNSVETYYLDSSASVTVETFPFNAEYQIDLNNIYVSNSGQEAFQYFKIEENSYATGLDLVCYVDTLGTDDMQHALNLPKDDVFNLFLNSTNISNEYCFTMSLFPNIAYVANNSYFDVYDIRLPLPDYSYLNEDDPESNIDIYSDKWIVRQGEIAHFSTRLLDHTNPPIKYRIKLRDSWGDEYWIMLDGSRENINDIDGWIQNERWEENIWEDKRFSFEVEYDKENIITFEALYSNETTDKVYTRKSQFLFYSPSVENEQHIGLPTILRNSTKVAYDSDGNLWFYKSNMVNKAKLYYDYFLVDYEKKRIWLREAYDEVRVDSNA